MSLKKLSRSRKHSEAKLPAIRTSSFHCRKHSRSWLLPPSFCLSWISQLHLFAPGKVELQHTSTNKMQVEEAEERIQGMMIVAGDWNHCDWRSFEIHLEMSQTFWIFMAYLRQPDPRKKSSCVHWRLIMFNMFCPLSSLNGTTRTSVAQFGPIYTMSNHSRIEIA